jgi:hypothetical protein
MKKQLCAAFAAMSISQFSFAENTSSFIISGDIGSTSHELSIEGVEGSYDDSDMSFSLGGYYVFSQNIGFGLRFTDFGGIDLSDEDGSVEISADAISATVILSTNLLPAGGEWAFGGELGLGKVSMDVSVDFGDGFGGTASDSDVAVVGGLYAGYGFTNNLQGVFSVSFAKSSVEDLDNDLTRVSFGVNYAF